MAIAFCHKSRFARNDPLSESVGTHDRIVQQEISYQSALASLTDAAQSYDIQRNQNTSDIASADQKALFARMDFEKYMTLAVSKT